MAWNVAFVATIFNIDDIDQRFFSLLVSRVSLLYHIMKVISWPRDKPWMTGQIRLAIRKRDRVLKIYPRFKSPVFWDIYRAQRNLVVNFVRKAKINYIKINQAPSVLQYLPECGWCSVVVVTFMSRDLCNHVLCRVSHLVNRIVVWFLLLACSGW